VESVSKQNECFPLGRVDEDEKTVVHTRSGVNSVNLSQGDVTERGKKGMSLTSIELSYVGTARRMVVRKRKRHGKTERHDVYSEAPTCRRSLDQVMRLKRLGTDENI